VQKLKYQSANSKVAEADTAVSRTAPPIAISRYEVTVNQKQELNATLEKAHTLFTGYYEKICL
jgi:hypothetical protein